MLDDFGVQDDVEPLAGACQILGEGMPVIDVDADECRVGFRDLDQLGGRIDADDPRPEKSRRLAEEPAAAADIENAEPGKREVGGRVSPSKARNPVANEGQTDRVELMQRREPAVGVPPLFGNRGEPGDLTRSAVDALLKGLSNRSRQIIVLLATV